LQQQQIQIVSTPDEMDQPESADEAPEKWMEKNGSQVRRRDLKNKSIPDGTPRGQEENHTRFNAVDDEKNLG
jgi:hypothetical protein